MVREYCAECEELKMVDYYTLRDSITDNFVGNAYVCEECVERYEKLRDVTCCIE